jgi:hypothetical protein
MMEDGVYERLLEKIRRAAELAQATGISFAGAYISILKARGEYETDDWSRYWVRSPRGSRAPKGLSDYGKIGDKQ